MKYFSREEVEKIGVAGSACILDGDHQAWRFLSSYWLYVEPNDTAFTPHAPSGFWEAWITKWISGQFDSHNKFVDVGANVGYYTLMAATHGMKVVAVEPNPTVANLIIKSLHLNKMKAQVWVEALSDSDGYESLTIPEGHSGGAFLDKTGDRLVKTSRLDTRYHFSSKQKVLMKIDAEGAEPRIWAGMQETLERCQMTICLEWDSSRYDANAFANVLFEQPYVGLIEYDGSERQFIHPSQVENLQGLQTVVVRNYEWRNN